MDLSGLFLSNNDLRVEREQLLEEGRDLSPLVEEAFKKLEPLNMTLDPSFQTRAQVLLDLAAGQTGFHSDSNGATVGSIFGMLHGVEALLAQWTGPLQDTLETGLTGHHWVRISDLAKRTVKLALQLAQDRD